MSPDLAGSSSGFMGSAICQADNYIVEIKPDLAGSQAIQLNLETKDIARITYIGMGVNVGLVILKLSAGYYASSLGLIADGFHSFSDLGSDVIILLGARLAGQPPDLDHPFGHGKFETLSAWLIAILLIVVGGWVIWEGISALKVEPAAIRNWWVISIAAVSLTSKEYLYKATIRVADRCRSNALKANAWHHRTDALSSAVVLFAGIGGLFHWYRGDSIAGIIVGSMVLVVGVKLSFDAVKELSEASPGRDIEEQIGEIISGFAEVRGWHRLRIRRIGRQLEMDVHIMLDADLTVRDGHAVVRRIERAIDQGIDWPVNPTIHLDPDCEETGDINRSDSESR